jgi:hypothetical protein
MNKMNKKLIEFGRLLEWRDGVTREHTRELLEFVEERDCVPKWYERLPKDQKKLWAEARALVSVRLNIVFYNFVLELEDVSKNLRFMSVVESCKKIAPELLGTAENRSEERWVAGVEERSRLSLGARFSAGDVDKIFECRSEKKRYAELIVKLKKEAQQQ